MIFMNLYELYDMWPQKNGKFWSLRWTQVHTHILAPSNMHFSPLKYFYRSLLKHTHALFSLILKSSVIRQKGQSENEFFKKTKHAKFSEKQVFLISNITNTSSVLSVTAMLQKGPWGILSLRCRESTLIINIFFIMRIREKGLVGTKFSHEICSKTMILGYKLVF